MKRGLGSPRTGVGALSWADMAQGWTASPASLDLRPYSRSSQGRKLAGGRAVGQKHRALPASLSLSLSVCEMGRLEYMFPLPILRAGMVQKRAPSHSRLLLGNSPQHLPTCPCKGPLCVPGSTARQPLFRSMCSMAVQAQMMLLLGLKGK